MAGNNNLTEDEMSVLMIAERGEFMLAIGKWEKPIKDLATKGFMKTEYINGGPQFTITEAGRSAMTKQDDASIGAMIEGGSQMGSAQKLARDQAEVAAKAIADCAKASSPMIGDTPETSARKWLPTILQRALDIINGG